MRKIWFSIVITAAVLLTACGQASPANPTAGAILPEAKPQGQETAPITQAPTVAQVPTKDTSAASMECQVTSVSPTLGPTEESMFPSPNDKDWILGSNPKAALTIIEYSDFQ